jgi:hypothetical protein
MKIFKNILLILSVTHFSLSADITTAYTKDGREVVLFDNGTWLYKPQKKFMEGESKSIGLTPDASTVKFTNSREKYSVWYDPKVWERDKESEVGDHEFVLKMKDEDAYAMAIYERIPIPLEKLKKIALLNMKNAAQSVKLTDEKMIKVNGESMLSLRVEALVEGIPFIYRGYYASGNYGTIQFITYTHISLEKEYLGAMNNLLNGLTLIK